MPKLWTNTIEAHRQSVHDAVLDAAASLIAASGLSAVTMSAIAGQTGIGRATLYKYFPDVETILGAWHQRQIGRHLHELTEIAARPAAPGARLTAVLEAYVQNAFGHRADHAMPHAGAHVAHARQHLRGFLAGLIAEAAAAGEVRADIAPDELAAYCIAALDGAAVLTKKAAVSRLLVLVEATLLPPASPRKSSRASATRSSAPAVRRGS